MVYINDSLTVVLVGDWNKLYIQPDWMAENILERKEIEIGVSGLGTDFSVSYKGDGVLITPGQSKMFFSVMNTEDETLDKLSRCLNNLIEKAHIPQFPAYGINADFIEEDGILFAEILDSMEDTNAIVENGYEVISTKIRRTLKCGDRIINMDSSLENNQLRVHFNEHHAAGGGRPDFRTEYIKEFIEECGGILRGLGYELEGDE